MAQALAYRVAKNMNHPLLDREGVAGLALLEACNNWRPGRSRVSFRCFLAYCIARRIIDEVRKLTNRGKESEAFAQRGSPPDVEDGRRQESEAIEQRDLLALVLEKMSEDDAVLLYARYCHGCTVRELAALCGRPHKKFSSHFYRTLYKARAIARQLGLTREEVNATLV